MIHTSNSVTVVSPALTGNPGDDLIAFSEIAFLERDLNIPIFWHPLSPDIIDPKDEVGKFLLSRRTKTLFSKVIIIGGGALISNFRNPFYSHLARCFYIALFCIFKGKSYFVYGVSVNPNLNFLSRNCAKWIIAKSQKTYLRDNTSFDFVNACFAQDNVFRCHDSVLDPSFPETIRNFNSELLVQQSYKSPKKILFIPTLDSRSEHQTIDSVFSFYRKLKVFAKQNTTELKVGFSARMTSNDIEFCRIVNISLEDVLKLDTTFNLFKHILSSTLVVTGRLHPAIVSFVSEIPFLVFNPTVKISNLFEERHYLLNTEASIDIYSAFPSPYSLTSSNHQIFTLKQLSEDIRKIIEN
jgi:polysaccharide pyruvyl transferase WcaK-like protein